MVSNSRTQFATCRLDLAMSHLIEEEVSDNAKVTTLQKETKRNC